MSIKIGVTLHPQHMTAPEYLKAWQRADTIGVDSIWNWDHFFPLSGDPNGAAFEGWTVLAACGMRTQRTQIGNLVLSMPYQNPPLLSTMARTLDHLTGGRLVLGLGAGWFQRDYREYGFELGTPAERLRQLEAGIHTVKQRWSQDEPKPLRGSIPLLIGGSGEKVTLRIVAEHADLWHCFGSPSEWSRKNRVLDEWCMRLGRRPGDIEQIASIADESSEAPIRDMRPHYETLDAYVASGAEHILYGWAVPFDFGPGEDLLEWRARRGSV